MAWSFQTVHHDVWDYDIASPPLLFPGRRGPSVAVGSKTGHLFLFDRITGAPHFPSRSGASGQRRPESGWQRRSHFRRSGHLVSQQVTEADVWGATPAERDGCLATLRALRYDGVFTPPSLKGSLHVPGSIGGLHWGGMAWDATNRLVIAPVNRLGTIITLIPRARFTEARQGAGRAQVTEQDGTPYAMSRQFFFSPEGRPCLSPPWGELVAVRVDTGEIAWRSVLGDLRDLVGLPAGVVPGATGSPSLADRGGAWRRVFIAATSIPICARSPPPTARAVEGAAADQCPRHPAVYTLPSGREMVAIAAGGHDTPLSKPGTTLHVFALPPP